MMKKLLPILITTTALAVAPEPTPKQAWVAYQQQLRALCPEKHLDLLAPAELLNFIEDYETTLSHPDEALVNKYKYRACHNIPAGAQCDNTGFLQAAIKLNRIDHFTAKLCLQPIICTAQSECKTP